MGTPAGAPVREEVGTPRPVLSGGGANQGRPGGPPGGEIAGCGGRWVPPPTTPEWGSPGGPGGGGYLPGGAPPRPQPHGGRGRFAGGGGGDTGLTTNHGQWHGSAPWWALVSVPPSSTTPTPPAAGCGCFPTSPLDCSAHCRTPPTWPAVAVQNCHGHAFGKCGTGWPQAAPGGGPGAAGASCDPRPGTPPISGKPPGPPPPAGGPCGDGAPPSTGERRR